MSTGEGDTIISEESRGHCNVRRLREVGLPVIQSYKRRSGRDLQPCCVFELPVPEREEVDVREVSTKYIQNQSTEICKIYVSSRPESGLDG